MPDCSRIERFHIAEATRTWRVAIDLRLPNERVDFSTILTSTFKGATASPQTSAIKNGLLVHRILVRIPQAVCDRQTLERFLDILRLTVTISDDADESHALYLHRLPRPTEDPRNPEWQFSRVGNLVYQAKSYSPTTGHEGAALELGGELRDWIAKHPRYRRANVIIPVPPGNASKRFDLPQFLAEYLSKELQIPLGSCVRIRTGRPQKDIGEDVGELKANVRGAFRAEGTWSKKTVLALDDLYGSGATMNELVRACRSAGAREVLALAATKNATFCRGVTPDAWYELSIAEGVPGVSHV